MDVLTLAAEVRMHRMPFNYVLNISFCCFHKLVVLHAGIIAVDARGLPGFAGRLSILANLRQAILRVVLIDAGVVVVGFCR